MMNLIHRFLILCAIAMVLMFFESCKQEESAGTYYEGTIYLTDYERMTSRLWLDEDGTFIYLSQVDEGENWMAFSGQWEKENMNILLKGSQSFSLWLKPLKNKLEVLDFSAEEVIGGKRFLLEKSQLSPELPCAFVANGLLSRRSIETTFHFCSGKYSYPVLLQNFESEAADTLDFSLFVQARFETEFLASLFDGTAAITFKELIKHENPCD